MSIERLEYDTRYPHASETMIWVDNCLWSITTAEEGLRASLVRHLGTTDWL